MALPDQQELEESTSRRNLREELFDDLSTRFSSTLNTEASLSATAQTALVGLLKSDAPTAADIIAAASKDDPTQEDANDE